MTPSFGRTQSILAAGALLLVVFQLRDIQTTVHSLDVRVAVLQEATKHADARTDASAGSVDSPRARAARAPVVYVKAIVEQAVKVQDATPTSKPQPQPKPLPPPPPAKKESVELLPLPSWALVPEAEANLAPLEGEGELADALIALPRSGRGILYNAIHRDTTAKRPSKHIPAAIKGATRMREAMRERRQLYPNNSPTEELKFVLFTEKAPHHFMMDQVLCRAHLWPECGDYAEGIKVFDYIKFYEDLETPPIIPRREKFQTWPELWLKRIMASLHSPFEETLVVDSDVYGCTKFEDLFAAYLGDNDVAATLAPSPFGGSQGYRGAFRAGFPKSYANYTERNLGLHMLKTGKVHVLKLMALFRDTFIRQANDTEHVTIYHDQCAFREALFSLKHTLGVAESIIPAEIGCRHESGCADGCLVVHRHKNQEMSRAELKALQKEKNDAKKLAKKLAAAAAAAALNPG